jgi:hypothetical protein
MIFMHNSVVKALACATTALQRSPADVPARTLHTDGELRQLA